MRQAALTALLASLGDTGHTTYITAEQFQRMQHNLHGRTAEGDSQASVCWHRLRDLPVAHLALHDFNSTAERELRAALQQMQHEGIRGLILDLRGCPGGWCEQAVAITSLFLTTGNVMLERNATGRLTPVPVRPGAVAADLPLCVLVDGATASSAEIFAGALQDHGRGPLIGTPTFGAGTLLQPFPLSDGSAVLLAVAEWRTPNGRTVWHKGLEPDLDVGLPPGARPLSPENTAQLDEQALAQCADRQFVQALAVLRPRLGP
jgi:carboxyl-terminal processing protease